MLVQFRIENHRSIRDEQTLSLVAAGDRTDGRLILAERLGESLLPAVALYGANASGKTNVLHALAFMCNAVLDSHRRWEPGTATPREGFALSDRGVKASLFEVDIVVDTVRYRYGFVLGSGGVHEEWLMAWPNGRKQTWFEREGETIKFGKNFNGENETIQRITRANSLFLSAAAQNNHTQALQVYQWFADVGFEFRRSPHQDLSALQAAEIATLFSNWRQAELFGDDDDDTRRHHRESIVRLLKAADLGIQDIKLRANAKGDYRMRPGYDPGPVRRELSFLHQAGDGSGVWLPLEAESSGTVTLLNMAVRIVDILARGALLCVDELEASLHPMLALELLRLFQDRAHNPLGAQLVFTTHDSNLLGNVLGDPPLRRDQIWFTEKDADGATHLYPLTDFHPRKEENLERGYLQGRYGAIPCLGELVPSLDVAGD